MINTVEDWEFFVPKLQNNNTKSAIYFTYTKINPHFTFLALVIKKNKTKKLFYICLLHAAHIFTYLVDTYRVEKYKLKLIFSNVTKFGHLFFMNTFPCQSFKRKQ